MPPTPLRITELTAGVPVAGDLLGFVAVADTTMAPTGTTKKIEIDQLPFYSPTGHTHSFASVTGKPTTLVGYGITDAVAASTLDTDTTLAANSDARVPTQKAVKAYVDSSVTGLLDLKGSISGVGNPNYPVALKGDAYYVSAAGRVGGAFGPVVEIGDLVVARADSASGTSGAVGSNWFILQNNLTGNVLYAANNLSDLTDSATARTNLGIGFQANLWETGSVRFVPQDGSTDTLIFATDDPEVSGVFVRNSGTPVVSLNGYGTVTAVNFVGSGAGLTDIPAGSPGGSDGQLQWNDAGAFQGTGALAYSLSGAHLTATAATAGDIPIVAKAAATPTAAVQEWQDSAGTMRLAIRLNGDRPVIRFGDTSSDQGLAIQNHAGTQVARFQDNGAAYFLSFGTIGGLNIGDFYVVRGSPGNGQQISIGGGGEDVVKIWQGGGNNFTSTLNLSCPSASTPGLLVQLKAAQTANAVTVKADGGATVFGVDAAGVVTAAGVTGYAPLDSPALTGTPTAPTATAGTNTTQLATTAFVRAEVASLVASAPGALDTLDELAAALGDDPNFATTITTALAGKQGLDATLTALAGLSTAADRVPYFTGNDTADVMTFTSFGRSLVDDADAAAARTTLGLGTLATQSGTFSGTASGTNTGDQTITLTGDVTGSGTGSFAATIGAGVVTLAKLANMATASVFYRKTAGIGAPEVQTLATLKTDLGLTGTNSGDQTITLSGAAAGTGTGAITLTQTIARSVHLGTPANATHVLEAKAAFAFTLAQIRGLKTSAGTLTLAVKINGTDVTGLGALAVTTTPQDVTATAANAAAVGDRVTAVVTAVTGAADLEFTLQATR